MKKAVFIFLLILTVGCSQSSNDNGAVNNENDTINDESFESEFFISFSEIEVVARNESLHVSGEAKTNAEEFYYKLEQGDDVIIDETVLEIEGSESWEAFEINNDTLEIDEDNEEAPYLTFYVKDNGHIINPNYVPIDLLFY